MHYGKIKLPILFTSFIVNIIVTVASEDLIITKHADDHSPHCKRVWSDDLRNASSSTEDSPLEEGAPPRKKMRLTPELPILSKELTNLFKVNNKARYKTTNFQVTECNAVNLLTSDENIQKEIKSILSKSPINNISFLDISPQEKNIFNGFFEDYYSDNIWSQENVKTLDKAFTFLENSSDMNDDFFNNTLTNIALAGYSKAQYAWYLENKDINCNKTLADSFLYLSASQGYLPALLRLHNIYTEKDQKDLAATFLKVAALNGHKESQVKFAYNHSKDLSDIQDERHLALLGIFSLTGNQMAAQVKSAREDSPEIFEEI